MGSLMNTIGGGKTTIFGNYFAGNKCKEIEQKFHEQ